MPTLVEHKPTLLTQMHRQFSALGIAEAERSVNAQLLINPQVFYPLAREIPMPC